MEIKNPKVLVAAPIYEKMVYCLDRFLKGLKELNYPRKEILLIDNSQGDNFFEKLKQIKNIIATKDKTLEEKKLYRLISSRNKILDYALKNNYDYALMMDADVIPPKDIIEELISCNKDIVSGLYSNYFNSGGKLKILPVVWKSLTEKEFEEIKKKIELPASVNSNEDLRRHLTEEEMNSNELLEVKIPSAGCMLLSKKVFEKIIYGGIDYPENIPVSDDISFLENAKKEGFKFYCYTKIKCDHLVSGKYEKEGVSLKHPLYE